MVKSADLFVFNVSDQIWRKIDQNEMKLHGIYDYECIKNSLSTYPLWPALKSKLKGIELFDIISFQLPKEGG